jgi:hypothetical protein
MANHWYEVCGGVIVACLVVSAFNLRSGSTSLSKSRGFWLETVMLWAFRAAWLIKGRAVSWLSGPVHSAEGDNMAQQRWARWIGGLLVGGAGINSGLALLIAPLLLRPGSDASLLGVPAPGKAVGYAMSMVGIRSVAAGLLLIWAGLQPVPARPSYARPLTFVALVWGIVQAGTPGFFSCCAARGSR